MRLIVYGTLKRGGWNHRLLGPSPHFVGEDRFAGRIYWHNAGGVPYAKMAKEPDGAEVVHGEVYEVPMTHLPGLDALEGHPRWYRRTHVWLNKSKREAVAYIYQGSVEGMEIVPDGRYPIKGVL